MAAATSGVASAAQYPATAAVQVGPAGSATEEGDVRTPASAYNAWEAAEQGLAKLQEAERLAREKLQAGAAGAGAAARQPDGVGQPPVAAEEAAPPLPAEPALPAAAAAATVAEQAPRPGSRLLYTSDASDE